MTPREIAAQYKVHDRIVGGGWLKLKPGQVTDDTTMALALGEAILAAGRVDAHAVADAFDAWMRAKPVDIGSTVRRGLLAYRKTGDPKMPPSEHDAGNGAAMRVLPVALATFGQPEKAVREACRAQAHVTLQAPDDVVAPAALPVPGTTVLSQTQPRAGSTNCGRNARKNSAVFGLNTPTTTPCDHTRRNDSRANTASPAACAHPTSFLIPSQIRYAAPAYFTAANAIADEASMADNPAAAATAWTALPTPTPSTETSPAARP